VTDAHVSRRLARWVHRVLLAGVLVAGVLMAVGLTVALIREQPRPVGRPEPIGELPGRAVNGDGVAMIELGLVVLILTPAVRLAVLAAGWLAAGDRRFAAVALTVLALLGLGVWLGVG
jgi:uncharacterized membrane protein